MKALSIVDKHLFDLGYKYNNNVLILINKK